MKEAKTSIGTVRFHKNLSVLKTGGWILAETAGTAAFIAHPSLIWVAALGAGASAIALNVNGYLKNESLLNELEKDSIQKVKTK